MKLFCYVHMYPPLHCAGSEVTLHVAMREMVKRGHSVNIVADQTLESYEYEGVEVLSVPRDQFHHARIRESAKGTDVLITHLDCTSLAMQLMLDLDRPLIHFIHNHGQLGFWRVPPHKAQLVIFNSQWIADNEKWKGEPWPGRFIVMHPVIEPDKYRCERGAKITFCNPTEGKGVETVHRLAEAMPDYEFLIVEGIYGEQVAPPNLSDEWVKAHPNIEHMKNTPDFREVLRQTKVLLMPSNYESYGRCAAEAACAGIPSIVHPTQGLWEALGDGREYPAKAEYGVEGSRVFAREELDNQSFSGGLVNGAGIFCLRDDTQSWKAQLKRLFSDEVYYRSRTDAALKLAASFNPKTEFNRLEDALLLTSQDWKKKETKNMPMWISDRRIWETTDGKLVAEQNGRIPQDAKTLAVGIGGELSEELARQYGFLPPLEAKAIEQPDENKMMAVPEENKVKGRKKKAA